MYMCACVCLCINVYTCLHLYLFVYVFVCFLCNTIQLSSCFVKCMCVKL